MTAVMGGQGCGGIFACVVNLATLAGFSSALDSAFVFFLIAIIFIIFSLFLYLRMPKNDIYRKYIVDKTKNNDGVPAEDDSTDPMLDEKSSDNNNNGNSEEDLISFTDFMKTTLWPYMLSVFLVFTVTLGLFPAVASFVVSSNFDCHNEYYTKWFVPIWCFTLFNVGDTAGRILSAKCTYPKPEKSMQLLFLTICRFAFVLVFPLCKIRPFNRHLPVLLPYDSVYIIIMLIMSISGGILSGQAMSYAGMVAPKHLLDSVGNTMGTCLVAGLLGGASFSFLVLAVM